MPMRSMLFVPADSDKKLAKSDDVKADVLILDLEDAVAPPRKAIARDMAFEYLKARPPGTRPSKVFVRINPLTMPEAEKDLAVVGAGAPDGIMIPKCAGAEDVLRCSQLLDTIEARSGLPAGSIKIAPIAGESARGVLAMESYARERAHIPRLAALTWGVWDLTVDVGATSHKGPDGKYDFTYQLAMSLTLLAAKAAGVEAIDTVYSDYKDEAGLLALCKDIRRQGWMGKLAIHPAQVPVIHEGFRPPAEDIVYAERVLAAFKSATDGVATLDGAMIDQPHLKQARYILELRDAQ